MKSLKFIVLLWLSQVGIFAPIQSFASKGVKTTITGIVTENTSDKIEISVFDFSRLISFRRNVITVPVKQGKFELDIEIDGICYFGFSDQKFYPYKFYGSAAIMIEPGDNLVLDYTKYDPIMKSIEISGNGSEKILLHRKICWEANKIYPFSKFFNTYDESRFPLDEDLIKMGLNEISKAKPKLSLDVYEMVKTDWISQIFYYGFAAIQKNNGSEQVRKIFRDQSLKYLPTISPSKTIIERNDNYLRFCYFTALVDLGYTVKTDFRTENISSSALVYDYLASKYDELLEKRLIAYYLDSKTIRRVEKEVNDLFVRFFKDFGTDSNVSRELKAILHERTSLKRGSEAYPFELKDKFGKIIRLSDFKGKVVLLDFMFAGCPGCIQMAPRLEEIAKSYSGRDFVLISISIDKDPKIIELDNGKSSAKSSIQLYTNGLGQNHPIIPYYSIFTYPTLVLIDKDGKLISDKVNTVPDPRLDRGTQLQSLLNSLLE